MSSTGAPLSPSFLAHFSLPNVCQKNPCAHKNKIGTSHPPKPQIPPPKTRNFMDIVFSCRKNAFFQAPIKLAQPFPAPELRTRIFRTRGFFWVWAPKEKSTIITTCWRPFYLFPVDDSIKAENPPPCDQPCSWNHSQTTWKNKEKSVVVNSVLQVTKLNAHSSTPTPVFLTSREETQTMVREKLGPKPRPRQTLDLPGKGETQTMVWVSGAGKLRPWSEFGVFLG